VALEQGEGGEFSCRQSRCSKAVTANATEPLRVLKRRLVRVAFNLLHADLDQAQLD
jgi:hypothetical protein